ncbi:hypothetical protein HY623_04110 [Candidatus Uhrbacteria bacterium]|nr:hypothetical protein [Candidatus Uhrbacteria bacterium]
MIRDEALFFIREAIIDFLLNHTKGAKSKDYEFITALIVRHFCEKQFKKEFKIGF